MSSITNSKLSSKIGNTHKKNNFIPWIHLKKPSEGIDRIEENEYNLWTPAELMIAQGPDSIMCDQ